MKITKSQLERVIKEELEEALGEKTINLTGRIVKKKAGGGSKSARLMPVLVTNSGKEYPIFVIGDNPFSNRKAFAYLGKQVGVSGVMRGQILRVDPEKIVTTKDSMRTQVDSVDTGPTQAIEDGDPTRVEEPSADQDQMYGKTRVDDDDPTRVDPNTLGARAARRRQQIATGQRFAIDRTVATRTRALDADEADFNSLVDDANARINKNKTRAKRTSAMDRFRDLTGSMTSRFRGRGSRRRREESITKNELLRLIREELEEALEATRSEKTRSYASPTEKTRAPKTRAVNDKTRSEYTGPTRIDISKLKLPGPSTHPDKFKTRSYASPTEKTRAPKTRVMEATKSNLQELIREELAKLK